ncbi:TIGR01440 family protein [Hazenella sp. IB182357]|uniref:UPF0340 protein IC620_07080 n=1 Tax=Polycladospora coralii TaxID=2771432 RepID=A0A926NEU2_9BACL|nr:TIGR01440 family protein [Polycladospora coralii]MBS7530629.1 TIGR01440 family protein [Polycladospora coralii]
MDSSTIRVETKQIIADLMSEMPLNERHLIVFGVSTSEVAGKRIGTNGSEQIAKSIFDVIQTFQLQYGFHIAIQCCEHLNRALVVEQTTAQRFHLPEVWVVPVPHAGGAMASYSYGHMENPIIVEKISADAGIDIGDTFIGMHMKPVIVPVRSKLKEIGHAHVTMAKTRPKLIGGARSCYSR